MIEIGGYFELELGNKGNYHENAVELNTGRNSFEYLLLVNRYTKVYLPYYTCDVLLEPIRRQEIKYEFYRINEFLEPIFDFNLIEPNACFLYTNYFGIKSRYINDNLLQYNNIIIDGAQAFYFRTSANDCFYSARKFFGVADGGYAHSVKKLNKYFESDVANKRCNFLIERIECGAENGYGSFIANENFLKNIPIKTMSRFTARVMGSIDYEYIANRRKKNFEYLHEHLEKFNEFEFSYNESDVPMIYPFLTENTKIRHELIANKVFVAKYWPNVLEWTTKGDLEYYMAECLIPLPIDQRYDIGEMEYVINLLK